MKKKFFAVLFVLLMVAPAFAQQKQISREYPWVMRSVEALGMGNAYYTKSDSKYAPFYNPAGLTRIKKWRVDLLPVTAGVNGHTTDVGQDVMDADFEDDSDVSSLLKDHIGKVVTMNASVYPGFTMKNFTIGVYGNAQATARPANVFLPELDTDLVGDVGVVAGLGMSFLSDERLQTGIAARYQYRTNSTRTYYVTDIVNGALDGDNLTENMEEASGFFVDLGVIYNFKMDGINPRVGFAINNIGTNDMGDAKDLPYSVNLSFGISPSIGVITSDIIVDFIDITQNFEEDDSILKRINLGGEARFWERLALRLGLHQGYVTVGAGVDLSVLRLNYAYYREELGATAGVLDDERHAVELVIGF